MKTARTLHRWWLPLLLILGCLFAWAPAAQADVDDDFAWVLGELDKINANPFPVSGQDVKDSKGLFKCLDNASNDVQVIGCIDKFKDTPLGKKGVDAVGGIPSWFWKLLDAYIDLRTKDYWGLVADLGEAAICIVAQVLAAGTDLCGLIKELIEIGEKLLDAGKAVAEFFKDLGEGAWNAMKGVYCASPLSVFGGCDDSGPPPKPKAQVIYEKFFAPKVLPDGLIAIESEDLWAPDKLLKQLQAQAKAKGYSEGDVFTASEIFNKAVDAQWSADIVKNVLKDLAAERNKFNSTYINVAADNAWGHYKKDQKKLPYARVPLYCSERFSTLGFSHVTRWAYAHPDEAKKLSVLGIYQWCDKVFWEGNKPKFAPYFKDKYHMGAICPGLGCSSKSDLQFCEPFMKSVGLDCVFVANIKQQPQTMVVAPALNLPLGKSSLKSGQTADKSQIDINQTQPAITAVDGTVKRTPSNALPDITSSAQIMIGSVSTQWGATVNVDDKQAFSAQNGVCQFTVQHTTRNIGLASTGAFDSIWTNSNAHGSWSRVWGSIASGGQGTQKDMVMLKPGMNILNLKLDNPLKVQESNENNNQFRVIVNLSGACGAASRIAPPSADRLKTPANPRLPVTPERASDPVLRR